MRTMLCLWATVIAGVAVAGTNDMAVTGATPQAESGHRIILIPVNVVDQMLLERLQNFAQENSGLRIWLGQPVAYEGEDAREALDQSRTAADQTAGDGVIAVVGSRLTTNAHGFYDPAIRAGLVNLAELARGVGEDKEKFYRRAERQVMRVIGMLCGLGPCPNPRCVMYNYRTIDELDEIGRNFCPPCLGKLEQAARSRGFEPAPRLFHVPGPEAAGGSGGN